MRIDPGSCVVGMEVLNHGLTLLTVTENGYGKRSFIEDYRSQTRGGKGVFSIRTSERNGKMVSLLLVEDKDELMLVTDKGKLIRTGMQDMSIISRNTQGVRLINLNPGEKLIAAARLPEEDEKDTPEDSEISFPADPVYQEESFDPGESHEPENTEPEDIESEDNWPEDDEPEDIEPEDDGSEQG